MNGQVFNWEEVQNKYIQEKRKERIRLTSGTWIFKILNVGEPYLIENDYKKSSEKYRDIINNKELIARKYYMRNLDVELVFCNNKPIPEREKKHITISESVWRSMIELSFLLKQNGYPQGDYMVYNISGRVYVKLAFVDEDKLQMILAILKHGVYQDLDKVMYWYGKKQHFNRLEFNNFYEPKTKQQKEEMRAYKVKPQNEFLIESVN